MSKEKVLELSVIEKMIKNKKNFTKEQAVLILKTYRRGVLLIRMIQSYQDNLWQ